ncbi:MULTISPECIES: acyl-CoA dehydrogenase family protein [Methylorubrum]|uniref:acyl-CoA dehydrogenase family protein n=1 Tax=Methylorubrum TaxID=2282523 RepID=UPI0020A1CD93|nr:MULTISPECIES: acyl-CoA dehydrogenase family protein [Methylorubrum]MCP1549342.1 alkylation response protein AidB-like acyl-CoA dehydrogenase [Methylorubrum zatmanii]MCP1554045.1 alkylation response protein AidB-like acyl-CoA dehydrogenase [Methylorubrum extorquens]MCP1579644.1 alkylation response protein AidB-like acyl-CoA dehydrogenase [Methylorubrum extorquens]
MAATARIAESAPLDVAGIVRDALRPRLAAIDAGDYPADILRALGAAGAYAHHADGTAAGLLAAIDAMTEAGRACLSTAFCMWCQDALVWYLAQGDEDGPRRHLAAIASGAALGGTGLSNPMKALAGIEPLALQAERAGDGYRVRGRLPWVSNLGPGQRFAGIASLPDGRRVMGLFEAGAETVSIAANARFVALEGTGTYTVMIRDAHLSDTDVITHDAAAFVPRIRNGFVLLQTGMGLGLARGVAALMRADARGRTNAAYLPLGPDAIEGRADALRERVAAAAQVHAEIDRATFLETLRLRLDVSWLALEAAQAAMLQAGARGYLEGAETFRRLREAQFVAIVTPSVKHITTELARGR